MIALFNFNSYLGGGETLLVRWASYMENNGIDYRLFFRKDSFIEKELKNRMIPNEKLCPIKNNPDYYYIDDNDRSHLLSEINAYLNNMHSVNLVSFCTRELYTLVDYCKQNKKATLSHMILHNQDNLYLCQSLFDKFKMRLGFSRGFSRKAMISFNTNLYNYISDNSVVISQSELQAALLRDRFGINIKKERIVALPVCDFSKIKRFKPINNHKVIWIGRICDTKIPSLCAMIKVINRLTDYSLTIVGDGDMDIIYKYIDDNCIDKSKITFVGEVQYERLGDIIKGHSIGYAIGTSIMEIGKYGIPTIMALYSPSCSFFEKEICGGLYSNVSLGNIGDNLFFPEFGEQEFDIETVLHNIDNNYEKASNDCYNYIKDSCDLNTNLSKYIDLIEKSNIINTSHIKIPKASIIRKFIYKYFKTL